MAKNITFKKQYTIECILNLNYSLKSKYLCIKKTYRILKRQITRCESNKYIASVSQKHASKAWINAFQLAWMTKEDVLTIFLLNVH